MALNLTRDFSGAETAFREALASFERLKAVRPPWQRSYPMGRVFTGLAQALAGQGRWVEAESLATQGFVDLLANRGTIAGDRAKMLRDARDVVVQICRAAGRPEQAAEWEKKQVAL